jgi:hypothetical protein
MALSLRSIAALLPDNAPNDQSVHAQTEAEPYSVGVAGGREENWISACAGMT